MESGFVKGCVTIFGSSVYIRPIFDQKLGKEETI